VPIVVPSSRADERGKVEALDLGADDYVTKPFGIDELTARLRTALRHRLHQQGEPANFVTGDLVFDRVRRLVQVKGTEVKLSPREYNILELLVQHAGKVLTHQFILREVWKVPTDVQYLRNLHQAAAAQDRTRSAAAALHPHRDRRRLSAPRP
jgi:two-component system KDP operon response regulator KdpE